MRLNPFKNLEDKTVKPKMKVAKEDIETAKDNNIVKDIWEYVKVRIEMGILEPMELTDVYSLDIYIGFKLPKDLHVILNGEEKHIKKDDYLVFDFNRNVSHVTNNNFTSFYRYSKVSPYQQLLSAVQLFKITDNADEIFVKCNYNKSFKDSEDNILSRLSELIMNGNVDSTYIDAYREMIDAKYNNELINYHLLSEYKAQNLVKKLKKKGIPFAMLTPLVDSIYVSDNDDFDVDAVVKTNQIVSMVLTMVSGCSAVAACMAQMEAELAEAQRRDNLEQAHSVDNLCIEELIAFKAQLDSAGFPIPSLSPDKIVEQMKQEAIEEIEMHKDEIAKDTDDIFL